MTTLSVSYGKNPADFEVDETKLQEAIPYVCGVMADECRLPGDWSSLRHYPGYWKGFRDAQGDLHIHAVAGEE